MTLAKARKEVRDALNIIQSPGSFARWHLLKLSPAELGLHMTVDGVGAINFPLRDDQAKQIIAKAKQSPYGRGEETVVDTSARNTWELDVGQFTLQESATAAAHNTGWSFVHQTARSVVIEGLGLTCDTSALRVDPYKMLLYERAPISKHTQSEFGPLPRPFLRRSFMLTTQFPKNSRHVWHPRDCLAIGTRVW